MRLDRESGRLNIARWCASPNFDKRDPECIPEAIIVHSISLPPGRYGGGEIDRFFQNRLDANEHPYFENIAQLAVSAHFLIDREGALTQFVRTDERAWHAGESICLERARVNNFSIGIELEGWDEDPNGYTEPQYQCLAELSYCLQSAYPSISRNNIFSHSDIAPGRKPDPGPFFDWSHFLSLLDELSI